MPLDVAATVHAYAEERELPSIVLGVARNGELLDTYATGTRRLGELLLPDADSVYRIASMTKSFTAAAVLLLRDRGRLALDDTVRMHLPDFADTRTTIRDLLTMNAGFPTDDPWGDRHEPTPLVDFDALVRTGLPRIRGPREGFEYSNLGFALLGRIITTVTGREYTEFVTSELLRPLGMRSSEFDYRRIPADALATGYAGSAAGLREEPQTPPGAFSPMGGLHSTVRDLTRWTSGFLNAFNDAGAAHPVAAETRREQQQPYNFARLAVRTEPEASASSLSYGYGLLAEEHSQLGRFVQHSGGYPGFGSYMRWHPMTGYAVVALSNRTYAPMGALVEQVSNALVADAAPLVPAFDRLWPVTREAMTAAEALLVDWDDAVADAWFAHNLDLDQDRAERRQAVRALAAGSVERDEHSVTSRTPAHARWRARTEAGFVTLEVLMSPDPSPRIQTLTYRSTEV